MSPIIQHLKDFATELCYLRLRGRYTEADTLRDELRALGLSITYHKRHVLVEIPHHSRAWTHDTPGVDLPPE